MATGSFTETTADGVTYAMNYVSGPLGSHTYTMTITNPDGTTTTVPGIPPGNVLGPNSSGTIGNLVSIGTNVYVIPPTATGIVDIGVGALNDTTVYVGGTATIDQGVSAVGSTTINVDGGSVTLASGIVASALTSTTINIEYGGTFGNGSGLLSALTGGTIHFGSGGGTFVANAGGTGIALLSGTAVSGFDASADHIEFDNLSSPVDSYTVSALVDGTQTIDLYSGLDGHGTLLGSVTVDETTGIAAGTFAESGGGPLQFSSDTTGDVSLTVCFLAGTHITVPGGESAIEGLRAGDLVLTSDGRVLPIRWVGINTVSTRFADPLRVMPIRIRAGALGENTPTRDLLVSPDHAMFIDDLLIQASALVNDVSIVREFRMPRTFQYYHVELEDHSLILAEGAPTETFVDNVDRMAFDNWAEHQALHGDGASVSEMDYPRAKSHRQVPSAIRARLEARAAALYQHIAAVAA